MHGEKSRAELQRLQVRGGEDFLFSSIERVIKLECGVACACRHSKIASAPTDTSSTAPKSSRRLPCGPEFPAEAATPFVGATGILGRAETPGASFAVAGGASGFVSVARGGGTGDGGLVGTGGGSAKGGGLVGVTGGGLAGADGGGLVATGGGGLTGARGLDG